MDAATGQCTKGCGFFGSPEQNGLCSKCYKDFLKEEETAKSSASVPASSPSVDVAPVDDLATQTAYEPEPCTKGCGFFGSPEQHGMCSNCYKDFLKEKIAKSSFALASDPSTGVAPVDDLAARTAELAIPEETAAAEGVQGAPAASEHKPQKPIKNRCKTCSKRVRLLGFQCRCGDVFCGTHRYPEEHACEVDYKERARDLLRKQNPEVAPDRLDFRV